MLCYSAWGRGKFLLLFEAKTYTAIGGFSRQLLPRQTGLKTNPYGIGMKPCLELGSWWLIPPLVALAGNCFRDKQTFGLMVACIVVTNLWFVVGV